MKKMIYIALFAVLIFAIHSCTKDLEIKMTADARCNGSTFDELAATSYTSPGLKPDKHGYYTLVVDSVVSRNSTYRLHKPTINLDGDTVAPCLVNGVCWSSFTQPYYYNPYSGNHTFGTLINECYMYSQGDTIAIRADVVGDSIINWWN